MQAIQQATMALLVLYLCICFYTTTAVPSVEVNLNDTRCTDGGSVCQNDSLLFTCTANESTILRVTLPSGDHLFLSSSRTVTGSLPDGFSVEFSSVAENDGDASFNYTLSLSIDNAFLLAGGMIVCDDGTTTNLDKAGCPVAVDGLKVDYFLNSSAAHPLGLEATLNPLCAGNPGDPSDYFAQVQFGVRLIGSEDCIYLLNATQNFSSSHTVFIGLDVTAYEYCATAVLDTTDIIIVPSFVPPTGSVNDDKNAAEIAGITIGTLLPVVIIILVAVGVPILVWYIRRWRKGK